MTRSPSSAWEIAINLLSRRDHSTQELRRKLQRKGFSPQEIDAALERCHQWRYLDDRRFALGRALSLQRRGRAVGARLQQELHRVGIDPDTAAEAIREVDGEVDPETLLRDLLQRRYPGYDPATADARLKKRVHDYFYRRGFTREQIFQALRETDPT